MNKLLLKYFITMIALMAIFSQFVACGSAGSQTIIDEGDQSEVFSKDHALYGIHAPDGWISLPIPLRMGENLGVAQEAMVLQAATSWEAATGKTLFNYQGRHSGVMGDDFETLLSSLADSVNGGYNNDDWSLTGKLATILGTTTWVKDSLGKVLKADIRFNSDVYFLVDATADHSDKTNEEKDRIVDLESLALHEVGHFLGLAHVDSDVDQYSIMNPTLYIGEGLTSRELSEGDIRRIQLIYGCDPSACI